MYNVETQSFNYKLIYLIYYINCVYYVYYIV